VGGGAEVLGAAGSTPVLWLSYLLFLVKSLGPSGSLHKEECFWGCGTPSLPQLFLQEGLMKCFLNLGISDRTLGGSFGPWKVLLC
jgi:hypothetical protein